MKHILKTILQHATRIEPWGSGPVKAYIVRLNTGGMSVPMFEYQVLDDKLDAFENAMNARNAFIDQTVELLANELKEKLFES